MTIDGAAVEGASTYDVIDPATGEVTGRAPDCSVSQLDAAMVAAERAFHEWRHDEDGRRSGMRKLAEVLTAATDELGALLAAETGKPMALAAMEPAICAAWLQHYAGTDMPRSVLQDDDAARIELAHRPLGVVAAITPWNFPLGLAMWKLAPALRAGNTVVLKPSPYTPLATLRMGELVNEVLPAGVVNVVSGGDDLGAAMTAHRIPRKVSFTGSVAAGKKVAVAASADLKRMTLELGGNDAAVLLDDVDLAAVAPALIGVAFFNSGQACALPKRIFVPDAMYADAVEAFSSVARGMAAGMTAGADRAFGPLSTRPQYERVKALLADAVAHGVRVASGGTVPDGPGFFVEPTILAGATEGMAVVDEEQFGPILPILRYSDVDDALRRANDTMYGLCGSVWSADADRARHVAEQLECGTTFVNTHAALLPTVPFGGSKWSGLGLENGEQGLLAFTEQQTVHIAKASWSRPSQSNVEEMGDQP